MKARQIHARLRYQGSQLRNEVQRLGILACVYMRIFLM
jgi:hypothetical protein